jgi:hypothetical protein
MAELPKIAFAARKGELSGLVLRPGFCRLVLVIVVIGNAVVVLIVCGGGGQGGFTRDNAGAKVGDTEQRILVDAREVELAGAFRVNDDGHHVLQVIAENILQQHAEMVNFVLVDRDDQHTVGLEETPGNEKPAAHKGQPLTMPPAVGGVDVMVVVLPVAGACVVGGVDIDAIDARGVQPFEKLKRVVIFGLNQEVVRVIGGAARNDLNGMQGRENGLAEPFDDGEIGDRDRREIAGTLRLT